MPAFDSPVAFCFTTAHDRGLVVLAILVAILASFTALQVAQQVASSRGLTKLVWLAAASAAIGGGIWSMHFIAMLAFTIPVYIAYDLPGTLVSLLIAVVVAGVGLAINAQRDAGRSALVVGGLVMGLGVAAMHYSGMAAMRMAARIVYDPWIFALSIAIAVVAATAALWLAFRARSLRYTLGASVLMGGAISGMHFTGMWAASFVPMATDQAVAGLTTPRIGLAVLIAVGTALILAIEFASVILHRRFDALSRREALALMRSEERLRALIENSSDLIFLVDRAGRIAYAAAERLGLDSRLLRDWDLASLFAGEDRTAVGAALAELAAGDGGRVTGSARLVDVEGRRRDFDFVGTDLRGHPAIEGFVFTLYDVTERARAARAMERAHALAEQASRAKSQFITNMSHELRTPLNAVIGFSEIMSTEAFGPLGSERYRDYARDIRKSGEHLLSVVNDILDIGRIEAGELALKEDETSLGELVEHARKLVAPAAERRAIRIDVELLDQPSLLGDPAKLRQVLINLLSNAVKFSNDGGRVLVAAHRRADGSLAIQVADQGIGIAKADLARIWQPFVQADGSLARRYEGSGLGLPIARGLTELHGGSLGLVSEPGVGTTVTVSLPAGRLRELDAQSLAAL
ncbi:PAS domain S-box-containing protein [Tistlia consotensis]|uniref:histidine kinase n=1 Tax=Tistlia consotensis USBA 355 TaxID=560819 RepID=A0A1Y6BN59_9PROT|nr:MHYT domain-containing protein [Tistlia consotensis]SMF16440.1 PAS domain S-box-containing protein [Tistlia consotensis USBA 355]SNR41151.1 PAS domain S-box-containing protein [Tistlia consotensis]